jgi:hypothetical protein
MMKQHQGVSLPFFRLRRKPAARATVFGQRFFACGKTAPPSPPALDGIQSAHAPSGTAHALRHSGWASSPSAKPPTLHCLRYARLAQPGAGQEEAKGGLPHGQEALSERRLAVSRLRLLGLYLVLLMTAAVAWAAPARGTEVYTWTDEDGVVHYSDAPNADRATKIVKIEEVSRPASAEADSDPAQDATATAADLDADMDADLDADPDEPPKTPAQERREKMARERAERRTAQAETDRLCALHGQRLTSMEPARRVFYTDERGESVRLDDDRRLELIEESREFLNENCD